MDCINNQRRMDNARSNNFSHYRPSNNYNSRSNMANKSRRQNECNMPMDYNCPTPEKKTNTCNEYDRFPLAMAYVPWQKFENIFELEKGFQVGTIFKDLDFPFTIGICARRCR